MESITDQVERWFPEMVAIRRHIHRHPELGMEEHETTRLIREKLTEYGVEIEDFGLATGVSALIRGTGSGRTIALRGDIDALPMDETTGLPFASVTPGVCHSCGHDIHTAFLLFCARLLQTRRECFCGNVRLLFQPAEELASGAAMMVASGVMDKLPKPEQVLGIHVATELPAGKIGLLKGASSAACDEITITIQGRGGHGAHPYRCVDPITIASYLVAGLQTLVSREVSPFHQAILSFGTVHGGTASNVIPDKVVLTGTLRTFDEQLREDLLARITQMTESHCEGMRAKAIVEIDRGVSPICHDSSMVDGLAAAAATTIGAENTLWLEKPNSGSDDFAVFANHCPGVRFRVGTSTDDPATKLSAHNPGVVFDERALAVSTAVVCQYVLDFLAGGEGDEHGTL